MFGSLLATAVGLQSKIQLAQCTVTKIEQMKHLAGHAALCASGQYHVPMTKRALWRCPDCGRDFANRNQTHTCAALHSIDDHFAGKNPIVRELFDELVKRLESIGPFRILPEKTRIAFQVRMSFAQVTPRKQHLDGHLVLAEAFAHPMFRKVETFSKRNHVHHFRLTNAHDLTPDFIEFLGRAYAVGCQEHVRAQR